MDNFDYINGQGSDPENKSGYTPGNFTGEEKSGEFTLDGQSQERIYRGEGVGRRESTFGDFNYSAQSPWENEKKEKSQPWSYPGADRVIEPEIVPPSPRKPKPSKGMKPWVQVLISGGVAAAVAAVVCTIALAGANQNNQQLEKSFEDKLTAVQNELQAAINKNNNSGNTSVSTPDTALPNTQQPEQTTPNTQTPVQTTPGAYMTPAQVYAQCVNSVVAINGTSNQGSSSGSGFILSEDGYVVTNYHVVEGQSKLTVVTSNGSKYSAEYIGGNEANDIAVIKMDAQGMPSVTIGKSSELVVGEQVAAIGNPLGQLASTLTVGYISAKDRIVATDGTQINMLQTDAAINPGNSGGPLFNMKGEVIGITSAKYSGTTNSGATIEGIGFAIPIDDVLEMISDLRDYGYITGGYLGITASDVDPEAAELYGLPSGALVREVISGSCAQKAGMKTQDIIVDVGGHKVTNLNDLSRALNKFKAGETVTIKVYRSGKEVSLSVVLDERPKELSDSSTNQQETTPSQPSVGGSIDDWFDFFLP